MATRVLRVDDADTRVRYSGVWELAGNPNEYNSTTHGTFAANSKATLTFNGTYVAVYGTIEAKSDWPDAETTYSIDGSDLVPNTGTSGNKVLVNQLFYSSPNLTEGQHTLVITNTLLGANTFWLDYFQIVTGVAGQPNSTSSPNPPTIALDNTKPVGSSGTSTPLAASDPGSRSIGTGAIVGIAIGGALGLFFILLAVWLCRRRSRKSQFSPISARPAQSVSSFTMWSKPKRVSTEVTPFTFATPPGPAVPVAPHIHPSREDIQSLNSSTRPPPRSQGSGYTIDTTLGEKRGLGANQFTNSRFHPPDGSSSSRTLTSSSSPKLVTPPNSGNEKHLHDRVVPPRRSFDAATSRYGGSEPPAYSG